MESLWIDSGCGVRDRLRAVRTERHAVARPVPEHDTVRVRHHRPDVVRLAAVRRRAGGLGGRAAGRSSANDGCAAVHRARCRHPAAVDVAGHHARTCRWRCCAALAATMFLHPRTARARSGSRSCCRPSSTPLSRSGSESSSGGPGCSRCAQIPVVAVGVWIALRLQQQWGLPFPILLIVTGLLTGVVGTVIGFPALRLRGLYLALITLMGAGAITLLLQNYKFPNGGGGFWGFDKGTASGTTVARSSAARRGRHRLLPVLRAGGRDLVRDRHLAHSGQARAGLGGDPPEPGNGGRRRRRHGALQAVVLLPVGVHHRRGGRTAGGQPGRGHRHPVPGAGLDHPAGRRADGRRLQHLGLGGRRVLPRRPAAPARPEARHTAPVPDHAVRGRRDPGGDDGPRGRDRRSRTARQADPGQAAPPAPLACQRRRKAPA